MVDHITTTTNNTTAADIANKSIDSITAFSNEVLPKADENIQYIKNNPVEKTPTQNLDNTVTAPSTPTIPTNQSGKHR